MQIMTTRRTFSKLTVTAGLSSLGKIVGALAMLSVAAGGADIHLAADALRLEFADHGAIKTLRLGSNIAESATTTMGLFAREAPQGELMPAALGVGKDLVTELSKSGLRLTAHIEACQNYLLVSGAVEDMRQADDRGVDVVFRLPFTAATWWASISEKVPPNVEPLPAKKQRDPEKLPEGAGVLEPIEYDGLAQNFMPIACVTSADEHTGLAVALPPDAPCRFRYAYLRETGCLELQLLLGLSQAAAGEFKSRAPFRFILYPVDGHWGLRDALRQYQAMFPSFFKRRTQASGLWLVSLPSLKNVTDPQNYAFWQATRLTETPLAVKLGLDVYPYTIVGQRELGYLKQKVTSYADVMAVLAKKPESTHKSRYTWEEVKPLVASSSLRDAHDQLIYRLRETAWSGNSVSFPMNPSPYLPVSADQPTAASHTFAEVDRALHTYPQIHGFYVDSLAMWGSYENYRRDHFAAVRAPLAHDTQGRVCLPNWMPHVDYLKELRQRLGSRLVFANGARPGRAFCAFQLDILGLEPSLRDLEFRTQIDCLRSLAGPKPAVCLLDYPEEGLSRAQAEEYVQRFVALGLAPEMRRVPWPRYKERDADLYARFLPIYRRLDRAGWQPVTQASATANDIWIERFGVHPPELYFSLYNPGPTPIETRVSIAHEAFEVASSTPSLELVENRAINLEQMITLPPHTLRVIQLQAAASK